MQVCANACFEASTSTIRRSTTCLFLTVAAVSSSFHVLQPEETQCSRTVFLSACSQADIETGCFIIATELGSGGVSLSISGVKGQFRVRVEVGYLKSMFRTYGSRSAARRLIVFAACVMF